MKIKHFIMISTMLIILVSCSSNIKDPLAGGEMMFWEVSDDDSSVYLLGSIHFGKADFYPLPDVVEQAYQNSETLGVEVNLLSVNQNDIQQEMMQNMFYQDGSKLLDHLSPETSQLLSEYLQEKSMDIAMFGNMKPGSLILTISALEAQAAGLDPQYGIDMHYLVRAREDKKAITEFESLESQMAMMFGDDELAEGMLYNTLKEAADFKVMMDSLSTIWQAGDAQAMNEMLTTWDTPEEKIYLENLFGERDVEMTKRIEEMLADNTQGFVILGAGHFVNDEGIIRRLAEKDKYRIIKF